MRVLTLSTAVALALACRVSAAVAVVPTGEGSTVVIERPDVAEREAAPGPTPHEPSPISVFTSIAAGMAHQEACMENRWSDTTDCPMTIFAPPKDVAFATAGVPAPVAPEDNLVARHAQGEDITTVLESPSSASPYAALGSIITSYAHCIACAKAGLLNAFCGSTLSSDHVTRRHEIAGRAGPTTTRWTTIHSTSTIASTTTTIYMTSSSTSPSFTRIFAPKVALETKQTSSTVTNPTNGVSIVETTVVKTITYKAPGTGASTTDATNVQISETCSNNTSTDTQTYLNISTFSMTGFTRPPASDSISISPFFTHRSSLITTDTTKHTTAHITSATASTNKVQASTTITLGSAAGTSTIDLAGFHLPIGMVAAMGACFVLALFL